MRGSGRSLIFERSEIRKRPVALVLVKSCSSPSIFGLRRSVSAAAQASKGDAALAPQRWDELGSKA